MFQAIEKECKTEVGYASIDNVEIGGKTKKDEQPSWLFAETYVCLSATTLP